jgi:hypothetical protein
MSTQPSSNSLNVRGVSRLDLGGSRGCEVTVTFTRAVTDAELSSLYDTLRAAYSTHEPPVVQRYSPVIRTEMGEQKALMSADPEGAWCEYRERTGQPPSPEHWQPIETAPKDGRYLIVGVDIATVWIVRSAWYRGPEVIEQQPETFDESDIGWWSYIHSVTQEKLEGIYEPTHWLCEVGETPDPYSESTKSEGRE